MPVRTYRIIELLLLFVLIPISFFWMYPIAIKMGLGLLGFIYVLVLLKKAGLLKTSRPSKEEWHPFIKVTILKLAVIACITTCYVYFMASDKLFGVLLQKPLVWLMILFIYSFFSVWPQEILYRTFFFDRYEVLFANKWLLIFVNALLFSLAHLFLKSFLVQVLTFVGGLLFAYTYYNKRSTLMVSAEHALYGNWLFTVGMGEMLAFPA